ncbi:hypothetical protein [Streptomyces jeddahensis]|uniref:Uncharacterized protein n=1 Tax=Streptomyces jeddahensis TaxID=1716141 RepID=A0A177HTK0_9ACTN|nr:hypothetical protein [Streptomyces jeddahensis]OAH13909.1 hypothetical protein STSP_26260 [Streptomyces jeddahensis]
MPNVDGAAGRIKACWGFIEADESLGAWEEAHRTRINKILGERGFVE